MGGRGRLPRIRGDRPVNDQFVGGQSKAPPHPRGSTRGAGHRDAAGGGSPASAGIDPDPERNRKDRWGLPRIRGDRPPLRLVATGADTNIDLSLEPKGTGRVRVGPWLPRIRGDRPDEVLGTTRTYQAPPHPRGSTPAICGCRVTPRLLTERRNSAYKNNSLEQDHCRPKGRSDVCAASKASPRLSGSAEATTNCAIISASAPDTISMSPLIAVGRLLR